MHILELRNTVAVLAALKQHRILDIEGTSEPTKLVLRDKDILMVSHEKGSDFLHLEGYTLDLDFDWGPSSVPCIKDPELTALFD